MPTPAPHASPSLAPPPGQDQQCPFRDCPALAHWEKHQLVHTRGNRCCKVLPPRGAGGITVSWLPYPLLMSDVGAGTFSGTVPIVFRITLGELTDSKGTANRINRECQVRLPEDGGAGEPEPAAAAAETDSGIND
ncbi:hypothetical protein CB1_001616046 [Camelus ferus]|nr:hypothetical protein CB1_001616046 [Camelus ferus]